MKPIAPARLRVLARALDREPRAMLLALMRVARATDANAAMRRALLADRVDGADAVALLLTPIADFGHDAVDRAFAGIWLAADD